MWSRLARGDQTPARLPKHVTGAALAARAGVAVAVAVAVAASSATKRAAVNTRATSTG